MNVEWKRAAVRSDIEPIRNLVCNRISSTIFITIASVGELADGAEIRSL